MTKTDQSLRRLRRQPLVDREQWPVNLKGRDELLDELLPHAGPMLLIDELIGWDADDEYIVGRRHVGEDHIGLEGHFPGDPVLPGTLLLEMLGQVGTALFGLLLQDEMGDEEFGVRATKILGAHFLREVRPGQTVQLVVQANGWDTFLGECRAQAMVEGEIAAAMLGEVAVL